MKTAEEHRIILKKIADIALSNGLKNSGIKIEDVFNTPNLTREDAFKFISSCHEGFKQAQKLIIIEIQEYQEELSSLKEKLKDSGRKKLKELKKEIIIQQEIIENRISSFSHIVDTIVWQLTGVQIATARRLYIQEEGGKVLNNSNISHAIPPLLVFSPTTTICQD